MLGIKTADFKTLDSPRLDLCLSWGCIQFMALPDRVDEVTIRDQIADGLILSWRLPSKTSLNIDNIWKEKNTASIVRKDEGYQAGRISPDETFTLELCHYALEKCEGSHLELLVFRDDESGWSYLDGSSIHEDRHPGSSIVLVERPAAVRYNTGHFEAVVGIEGYDTVTELTDALNESLQCRRHPFKDVSLSERVPVLHNGACGYRSCVDILNIDLGVVVLTVAKRLMIDGFEEDKEFGKCLDATRRDPEFSNCEKLQVALWCNGTILDVISPCFDVMICVFGSCFEKRGYILKAGVYEVVSYNLCYY